MVRSQETQADKAVRVNSMKLILVIASIVFFTVSCRQPAAEFPAGEWIDLTHDFSEETIYWVTAEPFKRTTVAEGITPGGFYYSAYNYSAAEHGGTHLDSPIYNPHFILPKGTKPTSRSNTNIRSHPR